MKPWYLYVVLCKDASLYTGITVDINRRLNEHNAGIGAKYTRGRGPVQLVHLRQYKNRSDASKAESKFKKLRRTKKLQIVDNFAMPGDIVELTGRYTGKKLRYAMVVRVRDYVYGKYTKDGAAVYDMSDGTTGFSYAYKRLNAWYSI
jgi:putative endonuclease